MQRKTRQQPLKRFLIHKTPAELQPLAKDIASWAKKHEKKVGNAYHIFPDLVYLTNERDCEIWTPLFALCQVVSPDQLERLHKNAIALCGAKQSDKEDDANDLHLLRDIRQVWQEEGDMYSSELVNRLLCLEDSPWGEREFGELKLNPRKLADFLRPFEVIPKPVRMPGKNTQLRGYRRSEMKQAWERYLDPFATQSFTTQEFYP
jgi:hypothetical protein